MLFAREGAKVLAADINRDAALETKRIIEGEGGICEAVAGDVSPSGSPPKVTSTMPPTQPCRPISKRRWRRRTGPR